MMISDEDVISVLGAASLSTHPPAETQSSHSGTGHQGHLGFADVVADDRWHWHGHGSVGTVSAPIQHHLHPSAAPPDPQQWMDDVCVCERER